MNIILVGSGKLAKELLESGMSVAGCQIIKWEDKPNSYSERSIVVHAGSGRQLVECQLFCEKTGSTLIELSTGLYTESLEPTFSLIICPNTSILMLKILALFRCFGSQFKGYKISITESHQSTKASAPGTAFAIAQQLEFPIDKIKSIREIDAQLNELHIPSEFLERHAYHKIEIEDGLDKVVIETKVFGHSSYSKGVERIISAVLKQDLQKRRYSMVELVENNWI